MPQRDLMAKAKQLLVRRTASNSPWYYVSGQLRRQLFFLMAYVSVPLALWSINLPMLAVAFGCFFLATKIRDVRWWVALSKEWPTTAEFVDWKKVEHIASGDADS